MKCPRCGEDGIHGPVCSCGMLAAREGVGGTSEAMSDGVPCPEDHPVLDLIMRAIPPSNRLSMRMARESECIEFYDVRDGTNGSKPWPPMPSLSIAHVFAALPLPLPPGPFGTWAAVVLLGLPTGMAWGRRAVLWVLDDRRKGGWRS
jgi:hypothetical protein